MKVTTFFTRLLPVVAITIGLGAFASAQTNLSNADIQRLQATLDEASSSVAELRQHDVPLASQLQEQLDDARDEIVYLKVKLRKNESIARNDYIALRDRSHSRAEVLPRYAIRGANSRRLGIARLAGLRDALG